MAQIHYRWWQDSLSAPFFLCRSFPSNGLSADSPCPRTLWLFLLGYQIGRKIGLIISGLPLRLCRIESITIRHSDFRQTLGVDDIAFLDDIVPIEQKGGQSVNLVRAEPRFPK